MAKVVNLRDERDHRRSRNLAHVTRDVGYRFIDQDPILIELCRIITDSGRSVDWIAEQTRRRSAQTHEQVTAQTIRNWLNGHTKNPQTRKMDAVGDVLGGPEGYLPVIDAALP